MDFRVKLSDKRSAMDWKQTSFCLDAVSVCRPAHRILFVTVNKLLRDLIICTQPCQDSGHENGSCSELALINSRGPPAIVPQQQHRLNSLGDVTDLACHCGTGLIGHQHFLSFCMQVVRTYTGPLQLLQTVEYKILSIDRFL
jgi:hypothetical protein